MSWVQIPCLMSVVAMLSVTPSPQWVVLNDSWCRRIIQLNEELLSARRLGVASAVCAPHPGVAVGLWVLYSRLGHVRESPKGDPAKKVGWSKTEPLARKSSKCNATMGR